VADKNLVRLGYSDRGFRNLTNSKRRVAKLEDLQGLEIRVVQSPVLIETFNTLIVHGVGERTLANARTLTVLH
jgi:TRAP-type C4-dicarboxylate transport system substrate-binding protein